MLDRPDCLNEGEMIDGEIFNFAACSGVEDMSIAAPPHATTALDCLLEDDVLWLS